MCQYCTARGCAVLCCTLRHCTLLSRTALYCIGLYLTALCFPMLYCSVLCSCSSTGSAVPAVCGAPMPGPVLYSVPVLARDQLFLLFVEPRCLDLYCTVLYSVPVLARDQLFLLCVEPRCLDLGYCLLLEPALSAPARCQVLRLIAALLRTPVISSRHKGRLHLQV
jgi:hypothetical protein